MKKYNYEKAVLEDILRYIEDNHSDLVEITISNQFDIDELTEHINDICWTNDSVTGNSSGSYTFNAWEAEENLCHNWYLLSNACNEFGTNPDLDDPEGMDVLVRCYLLSDVLTDLGVIEKLEKIVKAVENQEEE